MAKTPQPVCAELPPLPPVSIDVTALQAALEAGKSGEEAIAAATASIPETPAETPDLPETAE